MADQGWPDFNRRPHYQRFIKEDIAKIVVKKMSQSTMLGITGGANSRTAALLPFLRELQRFDTVGHPTASVACYPAS
jgi:hypothetical protein